MTDNPFDLMPVGYLTLAVDGVIRSINLAGAEILGCARSRLVGSSLLLPVVEEERTAFSAFLRSAVTSAARKSCEVTIQTGSGVLVWLRIVATAAPSGGELHLALIDITAHRQVEAELLASESLFHTLAAGVPVGIFRTDPRGECIYVNERWQECSGIGAAEALYNGWEQALHPDDREEVATAWYRAARERLPFKMEYRYRRPDGLVTWVQGQALPEVDAEGEVISYIGTCTDITERKTMEERLRASEAHLKAAQRLTRHGSWTRDCTTDLLSWSDEMFRITELDPVTFGHRFENFLAVVHPDDRELLLTTLNQAHQTHSPYGLEYRLLMPDGRVKWVHSRATITYDGDGRPLVMTGTNQDITERRQVEETLNRTRELRNLIIDAVPAMISYCDTDCRYQVVNRRYEELTGLSVKAIWGRHVRDVLGEKAWEVAAPHLMRVLGGEQVSYELGMAGPDGTDRTLEATHTPDRDAGGMIRGYVTLVRDITGQKKTEQTLQNYSRRLIDLEDEVRRQLAAELHDELGPDLTALNFNLALIKNEAKPEPGSRLAELIADSSDLVDGLSGKVRNIISRLQPSVLSAYGVEAAIRWYADQVKRRNGISVTVMTDHPIPRLDAERELALFRIAKESLTNAAKYSAARTITVRLRSIGRAVRLSVRDDGLGFIPTAASTAKGGGWGLTIMRMRAETLGGTFRLKTVPGKGTMITVDIPKEKSHAD